jgi:hypothetical protein
MARKLPEGFAMTPEPPKPPRLRYDARAIFPNIRSSWEVRAERERNGRKPPEKR